MESMDSLIWSVFDKMHTDFTDEPIPAAERFSPMRFYREKHVFRMGDFSNKIIALADMTELPTGSLLHILDDASHPLEHLDVPRVQENIFLKNESFQKKFILHMRDLDLDGPVHMDDKYIFRPAGLPSIFMKFRSEYKSFFRYLNFISEIPNSKECLVVVNHNPLFRTTIFGRYRFFRKLQLILASILNTTHKLQHLDKQQYILLPWGEEVFDKQLFVRTRLKLDPITIRRPESFHFIMMMHLLNFMWEGATTSIFDQLPEEDLAKLNLIIQLNDKFIFYNLLDLKKLNLANRAHMRFCNQLNTLSLIGRVEPDAPEEVKQVLDSVVEKTESEVTPTGDAATEEPIVKAAYVPKIANGYPIATPVADTVTTTTDADKKVEEQIHTAAKVIPIPVKVVPKTTVSVEIPTTHAVVKEVKAGVTKEVPTPVALNSTSIRVIHTHQDVHVHEYVQRMDEETQSFIDRRPELTPKEKARYKAISQKYKTLELDGESLESILVTNTDMTLDDDTIDTKKVGDLPDPSGLKSSLMKFDETYLKKTFKKHLVGAATAFQKNGVFLTGIKAERQVSEMNNLTQYTLRYEDIEGRQSTVKFRFPTVDAEGKVRIDGVTQVLKKQRIALPIVKISDTEISLASNQNKTRIIRNENKAHNYFSFIDSFLNSEKSTAAIEFGSCQVNLPLAYEYSSLADRYRKVSFPVENDFYEFIFDYANRAAEYDGKPETLEHLEKTYGVFVGKNKKDWFFINNQNTVHAVLRGGGEDVDYPYNSLLQIFRLSVKAGETFDKMLTEWVSIKILDKQLPVIFVLAYRYGLRNTLDYMGVKYTITERRKRLIVGESLPGQAAVEENTAPTTEMEEDMLSADVRYTPGPNDIAIKFADRTIWIDRYPLAHSLVVAGLDFFDLTQYDLSAFESTDVYFQLLQDKRYSANYLKGIEAFFDTFIDNMTFSTLKMMKEPTTVRDLLLRCAVLLSTLDCRPPSSRLNFRIRGYEQFNAILYNEMARQYGAYKTRRGKANTFSINPDAVFLRIIQNASMVPSESVNPLQDIKETSYMTYAGIGGRTADSFVVNDRKFATDDIGVISEATVDNQKVGINAQLSLDPGIVNTMGVLEPKPLEELKPANVLSAHALVFPFSTHDDTKRIDTMSL